jgi:outer membrane protease
MVDRDWADKEYDYLTHYSRHDAYSQGALLSDVSLGFSFPFPGVLALKTGIRFSYMYFSWLARDGFTQYSEQSGGDYQPWHSGIAKAYASGPGIIYSQHWLIFSPVLTLGVKLSPRFSLEFYASATPFVFCAAVDEHLIRKLRFQDYLSWGFSLEWSVGFAFTPVERFEIRLDWGLRQISGSRGETYQKSTDTGGSFFFPAGEAGAGLYTMDTGISAKIRL